VAQFADSAICALGTYVKAFGLPRTGAVGRDTGDAARHGHGAAQTLARTLSRSSRRRSAHVSLRKAEQARVLVLLSCKLGEDDGRDDTPTIKTTITTTTTGSTASRRRSLPRSKKSLPASYLTGLGVSYHIATRTTISRALSARPVHTYWITGRGQKLDEDLNRRSARGGVRGDALILDAVHDERNHAWIVWCREPTCTASSPCPIRRSPVTGPLFAPERAERRASIAVD